MFHKLLLAGVLICGCVSAEAQKPGVEGVWKAVTYDISGVAHPMSGLFIFSRHYYSANIRFQLAPGPNDDSNGNAGPYKTIGTEIVFDQWVQVHVRPEDAKQPILSHAGEPEHSKFSINGNTLILSFPSGNRFVLERLPG